MAVFSRGGVRACVQCGGMGWAFSWLRGPSSLRMPAPSKAPQREADGPAASQPLPARPEADPRHSGPEDTE